MLDKPRREEQQTDLKQEPDIMQALRVKIQEKSMTKSSVKPTQPSIPIITQHDTRTKDDKNYLTFTSGTNV